ncbi:MAG: T9SS type A sorting domain-containing protein [Prolixibacteraceae bacterium]|nr:T9SS type A sorting domain-containing protein [Prolixibacteraceae bacterium]
MILRESIKIIFYLFVLFAPFICAGRTYYVAPSGLDANNGRINTPFRTISNAIGHMATGDSCILMEGTYREKIVIDKDGIVLCAYPGENVLVTGCDLIEGEIENFKNSQNNEVCNRIKFDKKVYQLFIDAKQMDIARWPNKTTSLLSMKDWESSLVDAAGDDKKVNIPSIPMQSQSPDFWKGGYYIGVNSEATTKLSTWYSGGGQVISSIGELLHISQTCYGVGGKYANGNGYGYILNCLNALDAEKEWFWGDGYLYFKYPNHLATEKPLIEVRTRVYILNITANKVCIKGINFKAGTILIGGDNAEIESCTFRYISPFVWNQGDNSSESGARCNWGDYTNGSSGICVLGNGLSMKDCYVAHSWFNGIVLWGNSCTVDNCMIEDVNWMGKRCSGINSYGADNTIRYCTIRNTGASSIEGGNGAWIKKYAIRNLWEHNRCENACNLVVDQGFFYINHQNGASPSANSEWRHNLLIHNQGPDKGVWTSTNVGLYVDNNSSGYLVHHNVVVDAKEGIRYNDFLDGASAGKGVYFYNNTFYKVNQCMASGRIPNGTKPDADITVENNLGIGCGGYGVFTRSSSNVEFAEKSSVENADNSNFTLKESKYIDSGVLIQNIDITYAGTAPDIGAFETKSPTWHAGSDLVIPEKILNEDNEGLITQVVDSPDRDFNFKVYPNPVPEILHVEFGRVNLLQKKQVQIIDIKGRILFSGTSNDSNLDIDSSSFRPGTYIVRVNGFGFQGSSKLIKLN